MKFTPILLLGLSSAMIATIAYGQAPQAPAHSPAPPAAQAQPTLPAGHPQLPTGHPQLPMGHPALPSGHPNIAGMKPTTQPVSHGGIAIRAVQGTAGGPAIADKQLTVELYHQGKIIRKIDGKLDDKGILVLEDLPLSLPFQPVVRMTYQGVEYQATGYPMDSRHPNQQIDLTVYETTEQAPAWQTHMRHVLVEPSPEGLKVMEVLAISNPSDRTWVGTLDAAGNRATLALPLSAAAQNLQVAGDLHDCCAKVQEGKLVNTMPMHPGMAQMQLTYFIPAKDGQANLNITAPGLVKHMILFVPEASAVVKVDGLESAGIRETGKGKMRMFRGTDLAAGHQTVLTAALPVAQAAASTVKADVPKVIAGVGAGLILVVGVAIVLLKSPKTAKVS